jgi:Cu(I)/Ag(I) efflux system membrane fusion protein
MKKYLFLSISLIILILISAFYNPTFRSYLPEAARAILPQQMNAESVTEHQLKHQNSSYVCPMHPQIIRDIEGSCPICGMDLVEQTIEPQSSPLITDSHQNFSYVCPMHPQIMRDTEGSCPICGMDLVKQEIEVSTTSSEFPAVRVSPSTAQNMGIRTQKVSRSTLWKYIKTVGNITYNEDLITHVHPRAKGWVEVLNISQEGVVVEKGQTLLSFYSPDISAALAEYLATYRLGRSAAVLQSARKRLHLLNVSDALIDKVEKQGNVEFVVPITAPRNGTITRLSISQGMYIKPDMELFSIVDLSSVWVLVDVFEYQLNWIKLGNSAEVRVAALPGKTWEGKIDYIYPELNPKTRTLQVRLRFDNHKGLLKPNMFADVVIYGGANKSVIAIPREAIIRGENGARVLSIDEQGKYQPVKVITGMSSQGMTEILSGLNVGQEIVLSGQFLLDSESNLQASIHRMRGH